MKLKEKHKRRQKAEGLRMGVRKRQVFSSLLVFDGDRITEQEILLKGYGRVRDVKTGPDGALYVLTNAPDALLRITPK